MFDTTRRKFLFGLGALTGAVLAGGNPLRAETVAKETAATAPETAPSLKGLVHGLGLEGRLYPGWENTRRKGASILTTLNLADGSVRQTPLTMGEGHAAMSMEDGRILCVAHHQNKSMVVDPQHKVIAEFTSPETHVYGGHGLIFPKRNIFIMPMRYAVQKDVKDYGRMQVYDLKTLKLLDEVETGGLHPHEVHEIPGTDELITTHYGDIKAKRPPFVHNVVETKLTILDANTFKPKRHYSQQEFNAMVTHMRVDKDGWAYYVLTQYIAWPDKDKVPEGQDAFTIAAAELEKVMGRKRDFPIPYQSLEDRQFPLPLPFVRVNTQTGERQIINAGDKHHLRSQSVGYNSVTGYAIAVYYQSDNLVLHTPGHDPEVITANQLQLQDIRGVTDIPGTSMIAVMGTHRGASVMDLATRKVVAHYPTLNYGDTHLYYDAAAV
jgi:hypothetical protein